MTASDAMPFAQLVDWLEHKLPEEEAQAVTAWLENAGENAQADLAWLRIFQRAAQEVKLASPPPRVREELKQRFADYARARQSPGLFQRIRARLTFDSHLQLAMPGLRSAAVEGQQHQFIYTSDVAEIALNIRPHPSDQTLEVSGQLFPMVEVTYQAFSVQLLQAAAQRFLTTTDELGEFAFHTVPPGEYELVVSAGEFEVVVPAIRVQL